MFLYTKPQSQPRSAPTLLGLPAAHINCGFAQFLEMWKLRKISLEFASGNLSRTSVVDGPLVVIMIKRIYNRVFHEIALKELYFARQASWWTDLDAHKVARTSIGVQAFFVQGWAGGWGGGAVTHLPKKFL